MHKIKLATLGTSTGAVIPKETLGRLKIEKGDTLFAVETPDGYLLTPYDPAVEEQLEIGRNSWGPKRSLPPGSWRVMKNAGEEGRATRSGRLFN